MTLLQRDSAAIGERASMALESVGASPTANGLPCRRNGQQYMFTAMYVLRGNHSVLSQELRRYDRPRLRRVLEPAGFHVERMTYTNVTLFPVILAVRSAQRWLGLKSEEDADAEITVPQKPVNGLFSALLAVEAQLVSRVDLPFGSSLLCLARKPGCVLARPQPAAS